MVLIDFSAFVVCVECHAVDALIVGPRRRTFLQFMFSSTNGTGLFAPAFCMSVVAPAAFETSADLYIFINVAYRPLKFEFVLQQLSSSLWFHFNYHVPGVPFGFERELVLDVPFLQI